MINYHEFLATTYTSWRR